MIVIDEDKNGLKSAALNRLLRSSNKLWRVVGTGFSFGLFGVGAVLFAILLAVLLYLVPANKEKKQRIARWAVSQAARLYINVLKWLGLLSFNVDRQAMAFNDGQLIIANHPTLLDAIFLFSIFPNTSCIVKAAVANMPLTAGLVRLTGYIPNSEDREYLLDRASNAIKSGQTLVVFPEGTRSERVGDIALKRGAAHIALKAGCKVQLLAIDCQPITLRKRQPWYQVPDTRPHFSVRSLTLLSPLKYVDRSKSASIQARQLTRYWQELYTRELQPDA